jgi:2-keto-4-pentenoate hydratase
MDDQRIEAGAREILRQHDDKEDLVPLAGDNAPDSLADALAIQERVLTLSCDERGRAIGGWKIALTTPVMQALVGIDHPCPGAIFADTVYESPVSLDPEQYVRFAVESEIAVRIATDVGPSAQPYDRERIGAHVAACMPAIEIVDDRNWDYDRADAKDLVADNSFNFGCVLGAPVTDWQALDLAALTGRMRIDGEVVGEGRGADVLGHPFEALAWLANHLHTRERMLRAGDVVLMGSVVATKWPGSGARIETEIDRLGRAELTLT